MVQAQQGLDAGKRIWPIQQTSLIHEQCRHCDDITQKNGV